MPELLLNKGEDRLADGTSSLAPAFKDTIPKCMYGVVQDIMQ